MALDNIERRVVYEGDGSQKDFPFSFVVFKDSDITVSRSIDENRDETVATTEYSVELSDDGTGTVHFVEAPAEGIRIAILSAVPETQPMKLTTYDGFDPEVLNDSADRIVALIQQLLEKVQRAVILSPTDSMSANTLRDRLFQAAKEALESAQSAEEALAACEQIRQLIEQYSWDIPHIVDSLRDVEDYPYDGLFAIRGFGNPGNPGHDISNRLVKPYGGIAFRFLNEKFGEILSLKDFGAVGDGEADDTEAIQAAFNSASKMLYVPQGIYKISSRLSFNKNGQSLIGEGIVLSQFRFISSNSGLDVKGINACVISNLTLNGANVQEQGFLLDIKNSQLFYGENIRIQNGYNGINFSSIKNCRLDNFLVGDCNGQKAIKFDGDIENKSDVLNLTNGVVTHQDNSSLVGLSWESYAHSLTINNVRFIRGGTGLKVADTSGAGTSDSIPMFLRMESCDFDYPNGYGIELNDIRDAWISEAYTHSASEIGLYIGQNAYGVKISNPRVSSSQKTGISIHGRGVTVIGGAVYANSQAASGEYDGINIGATAIEVILSGVASGYAWSTSIATQRYGLNITTGATRILYSGCEFTGNITGEVKQIVDMPYKASDSFRHVFSNGNGTHFVIGGSTANIANYLRAAGAANGSAPQILAEGSEENIDIALTPKGSGKVQFRTPYTTGGGTITGYMEVKDSSGVVRKIAVLEN
jgi:hypothetical protein